MSEDKKEEFTEEHQILFLQALISNQDLFLRCSPILRDKYFMSKYRSTLRFILDYVDQYKALPLPEQVFAAAPESKKKLEIVNVDEGFKKWFLENIELFCRHKELESLILDGPDLLAKGLHSEVENRAKLAMTISLQKNLGIDYFFGAKERLVAMKDTSNMISCGLKTLDYKFGKGIPRETLNIVLGHAGGGKSLFLQNLAVNYIEMGLHVVYISLELAETFVANRIDPMVTGMTTKEIWNDIDETEMRLGMFRKTHKGGTLRIKKLPESSTCSNDIRAYLKEYEIQFGIKPDVVLVDYLDLMRPNSKKIDTTNLFSKDKYVSEELRGLAFELNAIFWSASQMQRGSYELVEFDSSHVAGGISKINTVDNAIVIFAPPSMKEKGETQIHFIKTRLSAGVGQKVMLAYDPNCLKLTDMSEDQTVETRSKTNDEIRQAFTSKSTSTVIKKDEDIKSRGVDIRNRFKKLNDQ